MFQQLQDYFAQNLNTYLVSVWQHVELSVTALFIAVIIGMPLGYLGYKYKVARFLTSGVTQALRVVPSLGILFLLIPFGRRLISSTDCSSDFGCSPHPRQYYPWFFRGIRNLAGDRLGFRNEWGTALYKGQFSSGPTPYFKWSKTGLNRGDCQRYLSNLYWSRRFGQLDFHRFGTLSNRSFVDWRRKRCSLILC